MKTITAMVVMGVLLTALDVVSTGIGISVGLIECNPLATQRNVVLKMGASMMFGVCVILAWRQASRIDSIGIKIALTVVLLSIVLGYSVVVTGNFVLIILKVWG